MGFAISWCAVPESVADRFLEDLGLTPTGDTEEFPESLIAEARLDTGWRLLWYGEFECPFLSEADRKRLSEHHELIYCQVEEHIMTSSAELWCGGGRKWAILHEGEDGPRGLECEGSLPESFATIRAEMEASQKREGGDEALVDYIFEIPSLVAKAVTGFKYDEACTNVIGGEFWVLEKERPQDGLLCRLFGGTAR
jgi:hypothetical protein